MGPPAPSYSPKRKHQDDSTCDKQESDRKRTKRGPSYYPPRFWDTLSTVRLSRRALKEFDRRRGEEAHKSDKGSSSVATQRQPRLLRSDTRRLRDIASKGGLSLDILRGYSEVHTMTRIQSSPRSGQRSHVSNLRTPVPTRTPTTTPYSAEFEQKMIDNGVFPPGLLQDGTRAPKPSNLADLQDMLNRPRPSLSPTSFSEATFEDFQDKNEQVSSESKAIAALVPVIAGSRDAQHHSDADVLFTRLDPFDKDISSAKPDIYYGSRTGQIYTRVRRKLGAYIIPSGHHTRPAAPNFFFEGKSAKGRPDVARRQAMHDGALGARGLLYLQNYGNSDLVYDGNAYTLTTTYSDGTMKLYATHPMPSKTRADETDYHMTQLDSFAMTGNVRTLRSGVTAYRNARDWTAEQRNRFIADANAADGSSTLKTTKLEPVSPVIQNGDQRAVETSEQERANL